MTKKELLGVDVLSMLCDAVDIPYSIEVKRTLYNIQMKSCTVTVGSKKFNCRGDESIVWLCSVVAACIKPHVL